ncbi:MAG: tripartite tricarboxylate transporter substrate binding protein [Betaproteobacteria bacterium]|nr:tripartite tricarboxylate transporter substrate binding protein [Betaproteobacteria bacterium]
MTRRRPLVAALTALTLVPLAALPLAVAAQAWPSKPVRIVVPFPPAGTTDILARALAPELQKAFGQPFVVENKPGAGGNIGAEAGARAAADGHTLTLCAAGFMAVNPSLYPKLPYDPVRDFAPVALLVKAPLLLVVNPAVPARSTRELVEWARANPGRLTIGNGGQGTAQHLGGELFTAAAGIRAVHLPYKGSAPATTDLLAGVFDAQFDNMVTLLPHVKSGRLRALGVSSSARVPVLPEVPTIAESALPGFETGTWYGIVAPAATPVPVLERLNREVARIVALPDVAERLQAMGLLPAVGPRAVFGEFIRSEIAQYGKLIRSAGIRLD